MKQQLKRLLKLSAFRLALACPALTPARCSPSISVGESAAETRTFSKMSLRALVTHTVFVPARAERRTYLSILQP